MLLLNFLISFAYFVFHISAQETCESNKVWQECGTSCPRTCENYALFQNGSLTCTLDCNTGCLCPDEQPIWNGARCISYDQCTESNDVVASPQTEDSSSCPVDCEIYSPDGCNTCVCNNGVAECSNKESCINAVGEPSCLQCSSNLVWQTNPDCQLDCDDYRLVYDDQMGFCEKPTESACGCPEDKPVYENGVCISYGECPSKSDQCESNMVWAQCKFDCEVTCDNYEAVVNNRSQCNFYCLNGGVGCNCPLDKPIYSNGVCISNDQCGEISTPQEIITTLSPTPGPTIRPTSAPTPRPTSTTVAPTSKPTTKPTIKSTVKPTKKPTFRRPRKLGQDYGHN